MKVGNSNLDVEIASSPAQIQQGLMHRAGLGRNSGMLFAFPEQSMQSFWMKDTKMPLSIAFLDEKGSIFDIQHMNPYDESPTRSRGPAKYALEVNRGWFDNNNVKIGDQCDVKETILKEKLIKLITEETAKVVIDKDAAQTSSGTEAIIEKMFSERDPKYEKEFGNDGIYENGHNLREAKKYIDIFDRTAAATGLPVALIIAVSWKETGFNNKKVSTVGAKGMMQLMQVTRRDIWRRAQGKYEYDAKINKWVTNCDSYMEKINDKWQKTGKRTPGSNCKRNMDHYKALKTTKHLRQLRNGNFNGTIDAETAILASSLYLQYLYKYSIGGDNWSKTLCKYSASGGDSCGYSKKILFVAKKGGFK